MSAIAYEDSPVDIRADLVSAHARTWERIAAPGTWFDGETRVAIAAEARNARGCELCRQRKDALSPYAVDGEHDDLGALPANVVEAIHRIVTDPGRLTEAWYESCLESGLSDAEYVEIVGVTCSTVSVDTFARAIGVAQRPLPAPQAGEPSRERPPRAKQGPAWVPWIAREDSLPSDAPTFGPEASNVRRSMSLVPDEAHGFMTLVGVQYLDHVQMHDFETPHRAIDRAQIELVAGRVSYINQCAY